MNREPQLSVGKAVIGDQDVDAVHLFIEKHGAATSVRRPFLIADDHRLSELIARAIAETGYALAADKEGDSRSCGKSNIGPKGESDNARS